MGAVSRVLVVEDEWILATEMEDLLEEAGFSVIGPAATVASAMQLLERGAIDAAILDINLTYELSYPLAETLITRRIPFVFVSGFAPADLPDRFRVYDHLSKPANPAAVLAFLTRV